MARRPRRGLKVPAFPVPTQPRFRPAYYMLVIGLGLMLYQYMNPRVKSTKDLSVAEGTLLNYSFKKGTEGKRDYGFWLLEQSERFVLSDVAAANFDTTAFKTQVPLGQRLRIEYNTNANPRESDGNQRIYSLTVPKLNKVYVKAEESIELEKRTWIDWLSYICLIGSLAWFIWQAYEMNRQKEEEEY